MNSKKLIKNLPKEYELMKNSIQNNVIYNLYSKFKFKYLKIPNLNFGEKIFDDCEDDFIFDKELSCLCHAINSIFCIYEIKYSITNKFHDNNNDGHYVTNYSPQIVDVITCNEIKCTIIEGIRLIVIKKFIEKLKTRKNMIINVSSIFLDDKNINEEKIAKEEIQSFRSYFKNEIKNNIFVDYTISPIICYMIRRFFCPREYFFDASFFYFNKNNCKCSIEKIFHFKGSLESSEKEEKEFYKYMFNIANEIDDNNKNTILVQDFKEEDFIILRSLCIKENSSYDLVIHIDSFHVFMMKKILNPKYKRNEFDHEINFCSKFSHRCFTPFYGFVKQNENIVGFIYKYMSNSTLSSFLLTQSEGNNNMFILMTINRIFQGLEYLQSNFLIHRDLKPSNILIDNNYLPYISDFETIRSINNNEEIPTKMTNNIGSWLYTSPEQDNGDNISYQTDIYSFGLIIYFLYEKKDLFLDNKKSEKLNTKNLTNKLKHLSETCINFDPLMRPTIKQIKAIILGEILSINYYEKCIILNNIDENIQKRFIYENIFFIQLNDSKELGNYFKILYHFMNLISIKSGECETFFYFNNNYVKAKEYYELSAKNDNPIAFLKLGDFYYYEFGVKRDYKKAKEYYELASKYNNSNAINCLGDIYYYGHGVKQDFLKAKKYYELAIKNNNSTSYVNLGNIYFNGQGVKQNFLKAKELYELAIKHDNKTGLCNLGTIYRNGFGVPRDILKAIKYFELAIKNGILFSLYILGDIYFNGQGIEKDYKKALNYYEESAKHGNSIALNKLGDIYFHGQGVEQNYSKANKYYEQSAQLNNLDALFNLGYCYLYGQGVKQDYQRAKIYFELSAKQNKPDALFYLGDFYSSNEFSNTNFSKAIKYYLKCMQIQNGNIIICYSKNNNTMMYRCNKYRDRARNDLGLLYLFDLDDIEKAYKYIKMSALNEYPYAQNNYGLLNQLYFDNVENAEYFYARSSKNNFALADYNIGYLKEKNGKLNEAIEFYIKASDDENQPLIFRDIQHIDKRLLISQTFVICFTNLKLTEYYFSNNNYDESKKYFIKSFNKICTIEKDLSYKFLFKFDLDYTENPFSYLKFFILNFPLFNINANNYINNEKTKFYKGNKMLYDLTYSQLNKNLTIECNDIYNNIISLDDIGKLFDFAIQNKKLKKCFIDEIKIIIHLMHKILYKPPYSILFGRVKNKRSDNHLYDNFYQYKKDIDKNFYQGFGIDNLSIYC